MQAMILAAGFGTRLLPYTKLRPKPLFPLLNEPLLLLTIRRLRAAGIGVVAAQCQGGADPWNPPPEVVGPHALLSQPRITPRRPRTGWEG